MTRQPSSKERIVSEYRLLDVLGRGSTGTTYRAEILSTGEQVAVKEVSLGELEDWKSLELLEREAAILAKLNHPAIPNYIDYFRLDTDGDRLFYIVQQLAPGKCLGTLVEEGWRTNEKEVKDIARQILEILAYLHQLNPPVIHRDIKPENLIRSEIGEIFLVDFGAVRETYQNELTRGSTVVGTYGYMAPEQFRGRAVPATDLYGLGATLLYLLTRRSPSELPHDTLRINFRSRIKVSETFALWLEKMLEPDLEKRFTSADEALAALRKGAIVKAKAQAKLGATLAGIGIIALVGVQYRWFFLSRLGYVPTGCNPEELKSYIRQKGKMDTLLNQPQSALWCGMTGEERKEAIAGSPTPLHWACQENRLEIVDRLLDAGIDPNWAKPFEQTALSLASERGRLEAVERLLDAGADPNLKGGSSRAALHWESERGRLEAVERLLDAGADPNLPDHQGKTALRLAVDRGHLGVVERLLDAGARPDQPDELDQTPLHLVSKLERDNVEMMAQLLEAGANPNWENGAGLTSLQLAARHSPDNLAAIEQLLEAGADPNRKNRTHWTSIHFLANCNLSNIAVMERLLDAGADPNLRNADRRTPLHMASGCRPSNLAVVERLLEAGVDPNEPDREGRTPLYLASHLGYPEVVERLLEARADPNVANKDGRTPLHQSSYQNHLEVVEQLLNAGANPNATTTSGETPLYWASYENRLEVVERLLEARADPNVANKNGRTPLDVARTPEIEELLKRYGAK